MHSEDDENYSSGYEWWLMTEAKKRNPDIKLYGLPWTFPAWLGVDSSSPYAHPNMTANYILKWIKGAKQHYNLTIDYIGIWNERNFDATYIKTLRKTLDSGGYNNVLIVAPDGSFSSIANAVLKDKELSDAVSILGAHYPGTNSPDNAKQTGKTLWSSEDYSTYNDDTGAGCWARILNQNYVNGGMTSTITWNLIASYYEGLPFYRDGLMTAVEPWSGHYDINGPIYVTAHTTQFATTDYHYLKVGSGSGHLQNGGSYVSFTDTKSVNLTIVIETMSHDHSKCIRPSLPSYSVTSQTATFILKGDFARISELCVWDSQLFPSDGVDGPQYFIKNGTIKVVNGKFEVFLPVDHVTTLSTTCDRTKGEYTPPPSGSFPMPYTDDFDCELVCDHMMIT
jgi:galactosylceramidase